MLSHFNGTKTLLITIPSRGWKPKTADPPQPGSSVINHNPLTGMETRSARMVARVLPLLITIPSRGWKQAKDQPSPILNPLVINHNPLTGMETFNS